MKSCISYHNRWHRRTMVSFVSSISSIILPLQLYLRKIKSTLVQNRANGAHGFLLLDGVVSHHLYCFVRKCSCDIIAHGHTTNSQVLITVFTYIRSCIYEYVDARYSCGIVIKYFCHFFPSSFVTLFNIPLAYAPEPDIHPHTLM